ncbi:MAG: hypothetical protein ACAF41_31395 [Leptolyngbya sp. BL-A-14]
MKAKRGRGGWLHYREIGMGSGDRGVVLTQAFTGILKLVLHEVVVNRAELLVLW